MTNFQRPQQQQRDQDPVAEESDSDGDDNPFSPITNPPPPVENNRCWEFGFKVDIPEFKGTLKAYEFLDWLHTTEEILNFKEVSNLRRVPLVTIRLHGRARAWWQQCKNSRAQFGKAKIQLGRSLRNT